MKETIIPFPTHIKPIDLQWSKFLKTKEKVKETNIIVLKPKKTA